MAEIRTKKNIRRCNIQLRVTNKRIEAKKQANNDIFKFIIENILIYNCSLSIGLNIASLCKTYRQLFMGYVMVRLDRNIKFKKQLEYYAHKLDIRLDCKTTCWPVSNCDKLLVPKLPSNRSIKHNALCNPKEKFVPVDEFKRKVFLKYSMNGGQFFTIHRKEQHRRYTTYDLYYDDDSDTWSSCSFDEWDGMYVYTDIIDCIQTRDMKNLPYELILSYGNDEIKYAIVCPSPIEMKKQNENEYAKKMKHKQENKRRALA